MGESYHETMCHFNKIYNNVSVKQQGTDMSSSQKRIRNELLDKVEDVKWEIKYKLRVEVIDVDIINALIYHHLKDLTPNEVLEYRRQFLGKDE